MDLYQLLPLLDGWRRDSRELTNIKVSNGEERELTRATDSGWIISGGIQFVGNPMSVFTIYYHDKTGEEHMITGSPVGLKQLGLVGATILHGATLTKADDANLRYGMVMSPPRPIPFYASKDYPIRFTVKAVNSDVLVEWFGYEIILIIDKEKFIRSLRKILGIDWLVSLRGEVSAVRP